MPVQVRIELDKDAIKQFLQQDEGIKEDLDQRANAVADAAEARMGGDGDNFEVSHRVGFDRQRASVRTATAAARRAEAESHVLLSSVDAARSP